MVIRRDRRSIVGGTAGSWHYKGSEVSGAQGKGCHSRRRRLPDWWEWNESAHLAGVGAVPLEQQHRRATDYVSRPATR